MGKKLSPFKVSKILHLYFQGCTETETAYKLGVDQSTVSKNIGKFKSLVEQQGIEYAAEEYGIMDIVESLHVLASELQETKLTVEEARAGIKMIKVFQNCGISDEDYPDLIQACAKIKAEDNTKAAVELTQLENATGKTWHKIVAEAASAHQDLEQIKDQIASTTDELKACQERLAAIESKKKLADQNLEAYLKKVDEEKMQASQDLEGHMKQVGLDMERLALVEDLASVLKEASVPNADLGKYIKRHNHLNQAGISLDNFIAIVNQAKVVTKNDKGKNFAEKLSHFAGLDAAIGDYKSKLNLLKQETKGLEEKSELKAKIEADIVKLEAERVAHESAVSKALAAEKKLDNIQYDITNLFKKQESLVEDIQQKQEIRSQLDEEIAEKEQKVSHLSELEAKCYAVLTALADLEAKKKHMSTEWEVFDSFLGIVGSSLAAETLEKFAATVPHLVDLAKQKLYSPQLLMNIIIKELSGGTLEILRCNSCQARS
ncbi:hypothetical protein ACFLTV_01260 [Chloroflexota bacterium]